MPGLKGDAGLPGRDGFEGIKGERGPSGLPGAMGFKGKNEFQLWSTLVNQLQLEFTIKRQYTDSP